MCYRRMSLLIFICRICVYFRNEESYLVDLKCGFLQIILSEEDAFCAVINSKGWSRHLIKFELIFLYCLI